MHIWPYIVHRKIVTDISVELSVVRVTGIACLI